METYAPLISAAISIAIILTVGIAAYVAAIRATNFAGQRASIPHMVLNPLRTMIKGLVIVIIATLVLGQFGIELMSIVTATLAMIAIGFFAVWSMVSHITATVFLVILKPFNMNDHIQFAGEETKGKVVDINLFYTALETEEGDRYQIPNNLFFQKVLRRKLSEKAKVVPIGEHLGEEDKDSRA